MGFSLIDMFILSEDNLDSKHNCEPPGFESNFLICCCTTHNACVMYLLHMFKTI